jgi:organic hydroperoxide reductase OsmC/OhrA
VTSEITIKKYSYEPLKPTYGSISEQTMVKEHRYHARLVWSGAEAGTTRSYTSYARDHVIEFAGKPPLLGSSDPAFRGDPARHSPEDLLLASLSACHMLWYLHLCAEAGIEVARYVDETEGTMAVKDGRMRFTEVVLRPVVTLAAGDPATAQALHGSAHAECFIANSVNFPVRHLPEIVPAG